MVLQKHVWPQFIFNINENFFTEVMQDLMIRENDLNDCIGGVAHGHEILQYLWIHVDDLEVTVSKNVNLFATEVKMI